MSQEEVIAIIRSVDNLKHRAMLWLIYAAGLRRSHNSSKTTEIYTHVMTKAFKNIKSPPDDLDL